MKWLRKIPVILCLAALVLPVFLSLSLHIRTMIVKHEMEEALEKEELVTLRLRPAEVKWYKKGKELLVGDALFDVKTMVQKGGIYIITGLFDEKEKELKRNMEDLASKSDQPKQLKIFQLLQQLYSQAVTRITPVLLPQKDQDTRERNTNLVTVSYPVIVPPPKHLSVC